ncbi:MAG: hypothetical protein K2K96_13870, partial [Lachnospiraceae bacterium]|nr:hypothetical protein [Lachnospiraceae bacterium]
PTPVFVYSLTTPNATQQSGLGGETSNPYTIYGNADTAQNANPVYGNVGTTQNANSLYGNAEEDSSGLSLEFLKRSDEERWRREHGGN